jgi:DNA primase
VISPDTIALVRDRTDLVALVSEGVPSLKRRGRSWVGLCPFHKEKSGSFHVNPDRGFFHCFGCKESGSAIDFVMKHDGATFPEAVRSLAERAGIVIEEEHAERSDVDRQKKQRDGLYAVSQLAATYFEQQLHEHPHRSYALGELARRGLIPGWAQAEMGSPGKPVTAERQSAIDDTLQAFRIGYAPSGWEGLTGFLRQQSVSPMTAEAVGLLVPRSSGTGHYDRFRHRLMFSVLDVQGRVIAFSGRALAPLPEDVAREKDDKPAKYINSPESPIYTKGQALFGLYQARHAIRQAETATLVEGNFDVVSLHAQGVANVVAPLGTAFTVDQAKLLKRFASEVVLLFDADAAGKKAVKLARETCTEAKLTAKVAQLPKGHDPDDFVRSKGAGALQQVVMSALGMLEFLLEDEFESFTSANIYEKKEGLDRIKRLLASEEDPLVRSMGKTYVDRLAGRMDLIQSVDSFQALERSFLQALAQAGPRPTPGPTQSEARVSKKPAGSLERAEIVGALIEFPSLLVEPEVQETLTFLEGPSAATVAALSRAIAGATYVKASDVPPRAGESHEIREKSLDTSSFLAQIPPAIQAFASERLAAPHHATREEALRNLLENGRKLQKLILERETVELSRETYKAGGDWEASVELARTAQDRMRAKHGMATHLAQPVTDTQSETSTEAPPPDPEAHLDDPPDEERDDRYREDEHYAGSDDPDDGP